MAPERSIPPTDFFSNYLATSLQGSVKQQACTKLQRSISQSILPKYKSRNNLFLYTCMNTYRYIRRSKAAVHIHTQRLITRESLHNSCGESARGHGCNPLKGALFTIGPLIKHPFRMLCILPLEDIIV